MIRAVDPVRIVVPGSVANALAQACALTMDGHRWAAANMAAARMVLAEHGEALVGALAERLGRDRDEAPGWALVALPARMSDERIQQAATGVLAAVGAPFNSIMRGAGALWIGEESSPVRDGAAFGGIGAQGLHIDAPNVERPPEYTSLLVMRADPAGGGASMLGDLRAAAGELDAADAAALAEPAWFEGRAEGLAGVGEPLLPFPVLDAGAGWIRWAAKILTDRRNDGRCDPAVRFAQALSRHCVQVVLERGQMLVIDQRRMAHGRNALGVQGGVAVGARRWIVQAKNGFDTAAPIHRMAGGGTDV